MLVVESYRTYMLLPEAVKGARVFQSIHEERLGMGWVVTACYQEWWV